MPRYSEFGTNTFVGSPAQAECHASSPTVQGYFSVLGWFDFEEGGGAVFELRMHMLDGVKEVLRQGPSVMAHAGNGPSILQWRKNMAEREGIRYTRCSVLDAVCLVRETTALLGYSEQKAMELKPWFLGYKTFMLSVHCYMVRNPDVRYFNDTGHLGLWTVGQGQNTKLTRADLASLAVQSPYILMMPRKDGSFSSRAAPLGDELPGIQVLLRIALYSAWWRDLRRAEDDTKKANQNRALAYALSEGSAGEHATRQQLLDAVALANQSKFSPELREYVGRTGNEGFFKNWTSTELKAMVVSNGVLGTSLIPLWVQSLVDQDAVQRKSMFNSLATTPSMTPRSTTHLSTIPTLRFPRVEVSSRSSLNTTPRTLRGYPWTMVDAKDSVQQQTPRDVNFVLGRNFPKRNRVLVPAGDLNAHVEYTGWSYPEFEATSRGKFDSAAQHEKYLDAAGLARLGGGRSVVASMPGVFARNFTPRSKKDFQTSLDNFQAEIFHRDTIATTQQLYLRPEVRGGATGPIPYMEAIEHSCRRQA